MKVTFQVDPQNVWNNRENECRSDKYKKLLQFLFELRLRTDEKRVIDRIL